MTQGFKQSMIFIVAFMLGFIASNVCAEDIMDNFKITLVSFSYDDDDSKTVLNSSNDWLVDRFGISKESDLETIQSSIQAYRYSWLRLYIDIPVPNLTIKSIYLSYIPKEQDKDIILIDRFEPVMLYRKDNSLRLNGAAIAYLSIKGKDENEINQMIKSSTLIARIEYNDDSEIEKVTSINIDTSNAALDRQAPMQGFQIHMNYCDVNPIAMSEIPDYFATKHMPDENEFYYMCFFRGVKEKNMDAPVLSVRYSLSKQINNALIDETNESMYKKSGDSELPWCDDMYQNESQYAEVRLLIWFETEKTDNEIEEFLRNIQLSASYSCDSFQYPFDKIKLSDGNHNSWRIGPRNIINIDLS